MNRADWERTAAIYLPLAATLIARLLQGRRPRQFAACLLGLLWTIPSLLALQEINEIALWWTFPPDRTGEIVFLHRAMPLELFLGWIILWGILPQLALPQLGVLTSTAVMVALDCVLMPLCTSTVQLGPHWLIGEAVAVALVLLPGRCLAHWTFTNTHLRARATLQLALAALLFLYLIPEIPFTTYGLSAAWAPLLHTSSWARQLWIQLIFLLALPGITAVSEFASRGHGTPIPYDPPQRLVTSGIYRYLANPMQLSCTLVMLAWAVWLRSGWMLIAALLALAYSAGLAEWDEAQDLNRRFGPPWKQYRAAVHNWRPRWRPYHAGPPAILFIAATCEPCTQLRAWIERRKPLGLEIRNAEDWAESGCPMITSRPQAESYRGDTHSQPPMILPDPERRRSAEREPEVVPLRRITYDPADGSPTVDGIRAMGRTLEHLNLGWALAGAALRLPGISQTVQLLMDASGLGPRTLNCSLQKQ